MSLSTWMGGSIPNPRNRVTCLLGTATSGFTYQMALAGFHSQAPGRFLRHLTRPDLTQMAERLPPLPQIAKEDSDRAWCAKGNYANFAHD
jgi:hypothetical protein